jgi:hypothetical protein
MSIPGALLATTIGPVNLAHFASFAIETVYTISITASATLPSSTLPLTTVFQPPASCLAEVWSLSSTFQVALTAATQCYPRGYAPGVVYSPGICPSGYQTAHATVILSNSEIAAICCPR